MKLFKANASINNENDYLNKIKKLTKNGNFDNYFSSKDVANYLTRAFVFGNNKVYDLLSLIKNNSLLSNHIKDISVNDIIEDNDSNSISFKTKEGIIKIDFNKKSIVVKNVKQYSFSDSFVVNNKAGVNNNNKKKEEKVDPSNAEVDNSYLDMNDKRTKTIIDSWSNEDRNTFNNKLKEIMSKLPKGYNRKDFTNMVFYISDKEKTPTCKEFTLINKKGNKLHCALNAKTTKYDCVID
nr:MAG TPA: hypothetical protein [Caudoviricetes sp.]DAE39850.1 MAG TPA: hypothetical protein [Caudoviricetes sp.]